MGYILMDERLERLAERFVSKGLGRLLSITFEQYVSAPEHYDGLVEVLEAGHGLMMIPGGDAVVVRLEGARAA